MRTIAPEGQGTTMSTIRLLVCVLLIAASGCQQQAAATAAQSMPSATEMLAAVDTGDIKTVRMLLEKGADPDARVRGDGTALILASRQRTLAIVEPLLYAGAGVDLASPGPAHPLIMTPRAGQHDAVS